jgi:hypothetical protein
MKIFPTLALLTLLGGSAAAETCYDERIWSGINGKTFRGNFNRVMPDGTSAEFYTDRGKLVVVALSNLIERDRQLIFDRDKKDAPAVAGDPAAFKPQPTPNRSTIPSLDPKKFGASNWEAMVDALWVSLLWWNQSDILEVPKKGDWERKAEWLHKELTRKMASTGKSSTTLEEAKTGLEKYFEENLKEVAACRILIEKDDLSFSRLRLFCAGANVVILKMTMTYDNGRDFSVGTALETIGDDGKFVFHIFGKRFTGMAKAVPAEGKDARKVEFVLDDPKDLPAYYAQNGARFFLGGNSWNGALFITPYIYLTPGKPVPLPPAEDSAAMRKAPSGPVSPTFAPQFPIRFSGGVDASREWNLVGGKKFTGSPVTRPGSLTVLKNAKGEQLEVTAEDFMHEDHARFCFWESCQGIPQSPARLDLSYRFNTSKRGSFPVNVSVQGTLGRVDFPSDHSSLIFDMSDGAFVATRVRNGSETLIKYWGRMEPEKLLIRKIPHFYQQEDLDRFATHTLPGSSQSLSREFPARFVRYPLRVADETMQEARIDFVLMENPVVLAGIYQLLDMQTPGSSGNQQFVFHHDEIPWHQGGNQIFSILAASRMMPVKMAWTNGSQDSVVDPVRRAEWAGSFSLELIRAAVPDDFPKGHFDIPQEARTLAPGVGKTDF